MAQYTNNALQNNSELVAAKVLNVAISLLTEMEQEHLGVSLALGNHNHFCGWRAIITQLLLHPAFYFLKERSVALVVYNRIERERLNAP